MALTVMMADAVATAAMDRSKIPAMMQTVVVAARISRTDDWSRMFAPFWSDRNDGDVKASTTKRRPKTPTIP